jgi:hypothetical protein
MKYSSYFLCFFVVSLVSSPLQSGPTRNSKEISPEVVTQEIKQLKGSISQELIAQLLEIAIITARHSTRLRNELACFLPTTPAAEQSVSVLEGEQSTPVAQTVDLAPLKQLSPEQKEHIIRSLSEESRVILGNALGRRLSSNLETPFRIPHGTQTISQLDTFFLLVTTLFGTDPRYSPLRQAIEACYGIKGALKIKTRLSKEEVVELIPQSFKDNFFTTNYARLLLISQRIDKLAQTYV